MTATEYVILVDKNDQALGFTTKLDAHQLGLLHRAFSIFGLRVHHEIEILLQQRAFNKYHSPGLWTNTCCSHPKPGESVQIATNRRLQEELGISIPLTQLGHIHYRAEFPNGLIEHEYDHIFAGFIPAEMNINANPLEVAATQWMGLTKLKSSLHTHPEQYTPWLAQALDVLEQNIDKILPI